MTNATILSLPPLAIVNDVGRAAVNYARAGLHVLPVNGKLPITRNGIHDATDNAVKVGIWFRNHAGAGVAVACGNPLRSGGFLAVLDVDVQHDGDASLAALEEDHGELPATWTVRTPSGGWHYWLKTLEPHRTRIGFAPGLELRGAGAYVVTAPSLGYVIEARHAPACAPDWLLGLAAGGEPSGQSTIHHNIPAAPRYVIGALEAEYASVAAAPVGARNDTLNRAAFALGRFIVEGSLDEVAMVEALLKAAHEAGLRRREALWTIRSGIRARKRLAGLIKS